MQLTIHTLQIPGYEKVIEAIHAPSGLHAFIAIHNTSLGPSLGGMRMHPYASREDALEDVLRLSKAMTLKSALAETGLGGGKSVLIGNPKTDKTEELLLKFAEVLNTLNGSYIAAEDVGISANDLLIVRKKSPYVAALPILGSSGDPSRFTAFGIYQGIKAVSHTLFGTEELKGRSVAIQGLGAVGSKLAHFLFWEGANLTIADLDEEKLLTECAILGATPCKPHEIFELEVDILCPCALGGIINSESIPKLKCKAIAGSANNQLKTFEDGILLSKKNILYAPDFVINAGGIINASSEFSLSGYDPKWSQRKTARIYHTLLEIFQTAKETGKAPVEIAHAIAEKKLASHS
jgi:leucine dehydrogenase